MQNEKLKIQNDIAQALACAEERRRPRLRFILSTFKKLIAYISFNVRKTLGKTNSPFSIFPIGNIQFPISTLYYCGVNNKYFYFIRKIKRVYTRVSKNKVP